jgi:hypothetical protein
MPAVRGISAQAAPGAKCALPGNPQWRWLLLTFLLMPAATLHDKTIKPFFTRLREVNNRQA